MKPGIYTRPVIIQANMACKTIWIIIMLHTILTWLSAAATIKYVLNLSQILLKDDFIVLKLLAYSYH